MLCVSRADRLSFARSRSCQEHSNGSCVTSPSLRQNTWSINCQEGSLLAHFPRGRGKNRAVRKVDFRAGRKSLTVGSLLPPPSYVAPSLGNVVAHTQDRSFYFAKSPRERLSQTRAKVRYALVTSGCGNTILGEYLSHLAGLELLLGLTAKVSTTLLSHGD